MEWTMVLQALLALVFVLGLLLLTVWVAKYCQCKSSNLRIFTKIKDNRRLSVVEMRRIDAKNSLALLKVDNEEFAVVLGASQNLLLKSEKGKK